MTIQAIVRRGALAQWLNATRARVIGDSAPLMETLNSIGGSFFEIPADQLLLEIGLQTSNIAPGGAHHEHALIMTPENAAYLVASIVDAAAQLPPAQATEYSDAYDRALHLLADMRGVAPCACIHDEEPDAGTEQQTPAEPTPATVE